MANLVEEGKGEAEEMRKYLIGLLVNNRYGVLTRIASMFARRGFNIESLAVGETENKAISRMTIAINGTDHDRDQLIRQLRKLHDVIHVSEMYPDSSVKRELVIMKINTDQGKRQEIMDAVNAFRSKIVDYSKRSITVEITGEGTKLEAFIELMKEYGIMEICRTGLVAMGRGDDCLTNRSVRDDDREIEEED